VHHAVFNCFAWKYLIPIIHGRILKGSHWYARGHFTKGTHEATLPSVSS
jgi:hypothetical protein